MLGTDWRIPTSTEWTTVDGAPQNWANYADPYNSVLKIHNAGHLTYNTGALSSRGAQGNYWSSTGANATTAYDFQFYNVGSGLVSNDKAYGFSVRCLRDGIVKMPPTLSNVVIETATMTDSTAVGSAKIVTDAGSAVLTRGICWNTTGNPTINDNKIPSSSTDSTFSGLIEGLKEGPTYYVRAYATNKIGLSYSPQTTTFKICPPTFSVFHSTRLNGSPVTKTVTYHSVNSTLSGAARCWITQNLGADSPASAAKDTTAAATGWFWQFNRAQGYNYQGTTLTPAVAWTASISESSDWTAATDPCNLLLSTGWRIPTATEWTNAVTNGGWASTNAYTSELKLHAAGQLKSGVLADRGSYGIFWSATQTSVTNGSYLEFNGTTGVSRVTNNIKANGESLRCLRDTISIVKPFVSNVTIIKLTDSIAAGAATVTPDGGAPVTARGLTWNSTGNPTIADHLIPASTNGIGDFVGEIPDLEDGRTYFIRAYATNSAGTAYSATATSFKICKPFTAIHLAGLNGAPVNKIVKYSSVSTSISGALRCWITQNLGADSTAVSATDTTSSAAGWYWQYNRKQGYRSNGADYTPHDAWVTWNSGINENNIWAAVNDPCNLLLGSGWRLPTYTEWTTADGSPQNWNSYKDTYASVLKLHAAGWLLNTTGALSSRGVAGNYWSSTGGNVGYQDNRGLSLSITGTTSVGVWTYESFALPVRCLRDNLVITLPSVSNIVFPTSKMTTNSAVGTATAAPDGGAAVTERGICWSTTTLIPTNADNMIKNGAGVGEFNTMMSGLTEGPTYYVRAYAINSKGIAYSPTVTSFKICNPMTVIHEAGLNGAPISKTVMYQTISTSISGAPRCWIAQNLGANRQAVSAADTTDASAGWYWQFNRLQGYKSHGSTYVPSNLWTSWTTGINENVAWGAGVDPCTKLLGASWRIPTYNEWLAADAQPQYWRSLSDVYNSVLKLHAAGWLLNTTGALASRGSGGNYWSSTGGNVGYQDNRAWSLGFTAGSSGMGWNYESYAFPLRCLRDMLVVTLPTVSNVTIPTSTMTVNSAQATAMMALEGGASVSERGLVWSKTSTTPTTLDNVIMNGDSTGSFTTTLSNLDEGITYYVRAYAINSKGTAYSPVVTSFKTCNPFTVTHTAGAKGAPVTKTITYQTISTSVSGLAKCWITQNLGSDHEPAAATDATEASAGWYWQYNRLQGYSHDGTTKIPGSWVAGINENVNWIAANDPCTNLLGAPWRLPTYAEWTAVDDQPQYWQNLANAYNSVLNLHAAGWLLNTNGALTSRGVAGNYWSSNGGNVGYQDNRGLSLSITGTTSVGVWTYESFALPVRCLKE